MSKLATAVLALSLGAVASAACAQGQAASHARAEIQKFCDTKNGVYLENGTIYACRWSDSDRHALTCIADGHCIQDSASSGPKTTSLADGVSGVSRTPGSKPAEATASALDRSEDTPFESRMLPGAALDRSEDTPFYPGESVRPTR
jgi:hypothetical protein